MRNVKNDNEQDLTTTCPSARKLRPTSPSEDLFLSTQLTNAATAMVGTLRDMRENLPKLEEARSCAKQHPWLLVSSAVVAGVAAGMLLAPARPRPKQVEPPKAVVEPSPSGQGPTARVRKSSWLFAPLGTLIAGILSTWVQASITAALAPQTPQPARAPPDEEFPDEEFPDEAPSDYATRDETFPEESFAKKSSAKELHASPATQDVELAAQGTAMP